MKYFGLIALVLVVSQPIGRLADRPFRDDYSWALRDQAGLSVQIRLERSCIQIDGAHWNCPSGRTIYLVSHWDPEHIPKLPPKNIECYSSPTPPKGLFARWSSERACSKHPKEVQIHEGRANWNPNAIARVFWIKSMRLLILSDAEKETLERWLKNNPDQVPNWVILAQQGNEKSLITEVIQKRKPRLGFLVNGTGPKGKSRTKKQTFESARKAKIPLLQTEDWGDLKFGKLNYAR